MGYPIADSATYWPDSPRLAARDTRVFNPNTLCYNVLRSERLAAQCLLLTDRDMCHCLTMRLKRLRASEHRIRAVRGEWFRMGELAMRKIRFGLAGLPVLIALAGGFFGAEAGAGVWYVNKTNGSGVETGKTWAEAFTKIQPALDAAHAENGGEVWVAAGTYDEPRQYAEEAVNTGALALKPKVALYGGFAGNEDRLEQRDWQKNVTVISGEKSRDGESAYHVVVGADESRLDGFEVTGGKAYQGKGTNVLSAGGGIACWSVSMLISNCAIVQNGSEAAGGGIYCNGSDVTIENCRIEGNESLGPQAGGGGLCFVRCPASRIVGCEILRNRATHRGGGVYCFGSSPVFENTHIEGNAASRGGGLATYSVSSPVFTRCTIAENQGESGGGIRICHHSNPKFIESKVIGNQSTGGGGGFSVWHASSVELNGCEVAGNASREGGGVAITDATMAAVNSIFKGNTAAVGAGLWLTEKTDVVVEACRFERNKSHAIAASNDNSKLVVALTRFKDQTDGIFCQQFNNRTFMTIEELEASFEGWKDNAEGDAQLAVAATGNGSVETMPFPEEDTSIEIATTETQVLFKGRTAVLAVFVVALMALVIAAGVYLVAGAKRTSATQSAKSLEEATVRLDSIASGPDEE